MNQNEKIVKMIQKETGLSKELAEVSAKQLSLIHPSLQYIVDAWKSGDKRNFIHDGISLFSIQEKEKCCYINAILIMSSILESPNLLRRYKTTNL